MMGDAKAGANRGAPSAVAALKELVGRGHELEAALERAEVVPATFVEALRARATATLGSATGDVAGDGVDLALGDFAATDEV